MFQLFLQILNLLMLCLIHLFCKSECHIEEAHLPLWGMIIYNDRMPIVNWEIESKGEKTT